MIFQKSLPTYRSCNPTYILITSLYHFPPPLASVLFTHLPLSHTFNEILHKYVYLPEQCMHMCVRWTTCARVIYTYICVCAYVMATQLAAGHAVWQFCIKNQLRCWYYYNFFSSNSQKKIVRAQPNHRNYTSRRLMRQHVHFI
jgi:hypothetical protein